jgi:hypothetical protein
MTDKEIIQRASANWDKGLWKVIMWHEPTTEGIKRYPPSGIYDEIWECKCKENCPIYCKGECGCPACKNAYYDAIDYD